MGMKALNHQIQLYFKRQKMREQGEDGVNSVMEDLDEFDRILRQVSMRCSIRPADREEIEFMSQIEAIFRRRASNREFPANSYMYYI
jgi:hypothetical protein